MTTAVAARPALLPGRVGAVLALASAGVHLTMLDAGSLGSLVMATLALACLLCARHLGRSPTARVWRWVALADVTMLVVHVQLSAGGGPMAGMHHGGTPMWLPLALVAAQLTLAATTLVRRPA